MEDGEEERDNRAFWANYTGLSMEVCKRLHGAGYKGKN